MMKVLNKFYASFFKMCKPVEHILFYSQKSFHSERFLPHPQSQIHLKWLGFRLKSTNIIMPIRLLVIRNQFHVSICNQKLELISTSRLLESVLLRFPVSMVKWN